jgi:tetratricopeptide (TPR) repeat protein
MIAKIQKVLLLLVVPVSFFGYVLPSRAALPDFDQNYYAPRDGSLLGSAEFNHMQRAIDQMAAETKRGDFSAQGAINDFKYILDYFPNHPRALALASELAIRARHPDWVQPYFEKSMALYPEHAATYVIYGTFLQKLGKTSDAVRQYEKALSIDADLPTAHYNLGLAYLEQRKLDQANYHAQLAYKAGASLPGLREKLKQAGAWKPLDDSAASLQPRPN